MNIPIPEYTPDFPSHPGETLLEHIEAIGMSQAELAERTGRPRKTINEIIRGKTAITPETALQLQLVLGISASFWVKRESDYQEAMARLQHRHQLAEWIDWIKHFPYKEMIKRNWLPNETQQVDILQSLLAYFGVVSPQQWETIWGQKLSVDFRQSTVHTSDDFAVAAWLRRAEKLAQDIPCADYDETAFRQALAHVKTLTTKFPTPELYQEELTDICRDCGVAVVVVPLIEKVRVYGASQWLSPRKALIALSAYYSTDDKYWFTFFHEAAHILLHSKKEAFIDLDDAENQVTLVIEQQADQFARDFLLSADVLTSFVNTRSMTRQGEPFFGEDDLCDFASEMGVSPSIVVGRLQRDKYLEPQFKNELKTYLKWIDNNLSVGKVAKYWKT